MTLSQEIILYFEIIPIISFLIYAVIRSCVEDKKAVKMEIIKLKKQIEFKKNLLKKKYL